ncbi:aldehyde dehydrogenase [Photobacterium profundum]|uniref:Aldehyde dehydrogenase family protein n=1 Tax=Photobacterium profundum 3TCK TaxID=314280 RepID=Q1YYW9_9GAMM|nr:aldehyde dehydrogenase [Photobacterium profundum]EAS41439.1 aldehyde dehydrogenase family protein [Photobacterium profundum 3TCK]PSV62861.1 aldehyde dehydrogenase [Photobacterium profundum]
MVREQFQMLINGQWIDAKSGKTFESINPATEQVWGEFPFADANDVDDAVRSAHAAFESDEWRLMTASQRGKLLRKLGDLVGENKEKLAQLESKDNGKLIRETLGQVGYLPEFFYYYAGLADKVEGETLSLDKPDLFGYTVREPLGVIAGIIPWNSPLYLTAIKIAPALATGNTVVLKPSEHASATLLELGKLALEAGFPAGALNVITGYGLPCGDALTRHPLVKKIAFTGGSESAKHVIRNSAENYAKLSLELGGKSPNIIFNDADIDSAVNGAVAGIFAAAGQSCVSGSRLLVQEDIYEEFVTRLTERAERIVVGDPSHIETEMGPMATASQLAIVERFVDVALTEGAKLRTGGKRADIQSGWFYTPTILECNSNNDTLMQEEVFGPVAAVIPFKDEAEALAMANDSKYGLAAGIWTQNLAKAHRMIKGIRSGIVWVNTYRAVSASAPIGGYGQSGYGRECGIDSINEFTQIKTVWINTSSEPMADPFIMR